MVVTVLGADVRLPGVIRIEMIVAALLCFLLSSQDPVPSVPSRIEETPVVGEKRPRYADMEVKIEEWKQRYPKLIHETMLGKTLEGHPIPLLRLSDDTEPNTKEPGVLLVTGVHPRESQPPICLLWLADELLSRYGKDERITKLLRDRQIYLVPMLNVDGKLYDETAQAPQPGRDWRKNRHPNSDGSTGVDLNRNFPVRWGGFRDIDATWHVRTTDTESNIYEGPMSLSEPESSALAKFVSDHASELRLFVDFHSPLRKVLTPSYLFGPDASRYQTLLDGIRTRQTDKPYTMTEIKTDEEPRPGSRPGDTGLSYTYAYYIAGVYGMNIEIGLSPTEAKKNMGNPDLTGKHYPSLKSIREEYDANIREPFLFLLEAAGDLPKVEQGKEQFVRSVVGGKPVSGATVALSPELAIGSTATWAVLTSSSSDAVVQSEVRRMPCTMNGFTVAISADAKPGTVVPLLLTVWDNDRHVTHCPIMLTIEANETIVPKDGAKR